ncbi:unnamed protein product (macronuclear) [Paramecium tetraurelia]|uniref:RING-type domain-containing protein n=1 Tax=Paramecium tetraurelia TaxID=5888 RepID=A0CDM9_PARTE|nr:uncharacterized protein GSPATT00007107001 [Paramecium tetraurelia]CAK68896.1 unnamed protein product [Paramecium tetraurelia]|eukprot:XP_001436293.1 hypothetical protein (macronuclear) [Paramecium tetraurelia strain d4-2]
MIIYTIFLWLVQSLPNYYGTAQPDTQQMIQLNYTQKVNSLIIKFDKREDDVLCLVSPSDLESTKLSDLDLSYNPKGAEIYDYQSYLANNENQLVQLDYVALIYIKCLQLNQTQYQHISLEIYYSENQHVQGCINDCNGYNYPDVMDSVCVAEQCHCLDGAFGQYCQFQSTQIQSNVFSSFTLDSHDWKYFQYKFSSKDINLFLQNEEDELYYSFVLKVNPQLSIPTMKNSQKLLALNNIQQELRSKLNNTYVDVIYIGIYNNQSKSVNLQFKIITDEEEQESTFERNKIIIVVTGCVVGSLLLFAFGLSALKSRQQRQFQQQIQEVIRRNLDQVQNMEQMQAQSPDRQIIQANNKGFSLRFIKDHFKGHNYEKITKVYPGLSQFEECAVCLEQMKKATTKLQKICSVTPCFHIFHSMCLEEWLLRQKNCPFCRSEFTRKKLIKEYPWLEINTMRVNNSDSTYLSRMKNNLETVNESQIEFAKQYPKDLEQQSNQIEEINE